MHHRCAFVTLLAAPSDEPCAHCCRHTSSSLFSPLPSRVALAQVARRTQAATENPWHGDVTLFDFLLKKQMVCPRDMVLMYAPMVLVQGRALPGNVESSTKIRTNQHALNLRNQQPVSHYCNVVNALYTEFRHINQLPFTDGGRFRQ